MKDTMMTYHKMNDTKGLFQIALGVMLFGIGGFIYLAFRSTSLKMFEWCRQLGVYNYILQIRNALHSINLNDFFLFSLPDGLWVTAYIIIVDFIWCKNCRMQLLWGCLLPVVGLCSELLQGLGFVNGTFDVMDILCYTIPYIIYLTFKLSKNEEI